MSSRAPVPTGRCIGCRHNFALGPCGGCGSVGDPDDHWDGSLPSDVVTVPKIRVSDLCLEPVAAKNEREFAGSCIRLKGHMGKHQKITNGMTAAEADAITAQDVP